MFFPSVNPSDPIAESQTVVRYMKITTLLTLLQGRVFIPTLKTLQRTDPTESGLFLPFIKDNLDVILEDQTWFRSRASDMERRRFYRGPYWIGELGGHVACDIWLRELALRRCIWCWYAERPESMGMWNNYGSHGVAIVSKVKNVRDALSLPDDALSSVAKVVYLPLDDTARLRIPHDSVFYTRPYYVKQEAYKYENEIRFVLACEPLSTSLKGGVLLQVNPKILIEEVVISPHIVEDEACAVRDLLSSLSLLPRERIKVSSLLNPGSSLNKELAQTVFTFETWESMQLEYVRDILGGSHQEKDSNGEAIPEIMRQV